MDVSRASAAAVELSVALTALVGHPRFKIYNHINGRQTHLEPINMLQAMFTCIVQVKHKPLWHLC